MALAQSPLPHVHHTHRALAAAVGKGVALLRVEFCSCDHLHAKSCL